MERRYKKEIVAFGKKLKELRTARGLSQLDIEVETGVARTEVSRIENGLKNIELITIIKLADALKVEVEELFKK